MRGRDEIMYNNTNYNNNKDTNYDDYDNSYVAAIVFRGCAEAMYKHDYGCDREMQVSDVGAGYADDDIL